MPNERTMRPLFTGLFLKGLEDPSREKELFWRNFKIICLLAELEEASNYSPTSEQRTMLLSYRPMYHLHSAFFEGVDNWEEEHQALQELLDKDIINDAEYENMQMPIMNYPLSPFMRKTIVDMAARHVSKPENTLIINCGTGALIDELSEEMKKSNLTGVEINSLEARIANYLFKDKTIEHNSLSGVSLTNNTYDVVIGSTPRADFLIKDYSLVDDKLDGQYQIPSLPVQEYYLTKALQKLKPNGVLVLAIGHEVLDKEDSYWRRYLAKRAEFLGALRLSKDSFLSPSVGEPIIMDIICLRKRTEVLTSLTDDELWVNTSYQAELCKSINSYFAAHLEQILPDLGERKIMNEQA